jgi:hypothetical protein
VAVEQRLQCSTQPCPVAAPAAQQQTKHSTVECVAQAAECMWLLCYNAVAGVAGWTHVVGAADTSEATAALQCGWFSCVLADGCCQLRLSRCSSSSC